MPEGDVVWWTARRLHRALAGRKLTVSDFRVPRYATADLTGRVVREAVSRGKHLLIRVDGDPPLTVHTHMRMEGSWRIGRLMEQTWRSRAGHQVRLVLGNDSWQAVGYQLGVVEVLRTAHEDRVTGHLGPDLLGPDWDPEEAVRKLRAAPDRPIGEALLDQRNLAGIGTWFLAEMLFLRGIEPSRPVRSVSGEDLTALVDLGHRLLDANKVRPRHTSTGDTTPGREAWVYGRAGKPCRRCGTVIRRGGAGPPGQERLRFWCPNCQR